MTRTVTAMFDHRHDAEAAKERLKQSRVDADHVHIHDKSSAGYSETGRSTSSEPGMWASIKNAFLPDEDRHTYEEGIRRGGYVLTADVDDNCVDDAVRVLEEANTVDIDERSQQWRSSGWDYAGTGAGMGAAGATAFGATGGSDRDMDRDTNRMGMGSADEQVIPVVEEELVVGKREVDRGSVRVRSYVTERPVHEQVRLRDEHVEVERRPVDRSVDSLTGDAFQERTIDVTATGEEAVVGKTAHVVEEVVVSKTSGERVEEIDDTVRRTEVDVDRDATDTRRDRDLGGTGMDRDFSGSSTGTDRDDFRG